jgi:membrane peptidoglycan carboxypeptidase
MGITSTLSRYLSITLGAVSVSPLEMCDAYSTLASGGLHRDAVCITKIEDRNGNVVYEHQDNPTRAVSEAVAEAVTNVLEGVVANGATGYYVADYNTTNQPIAGKTGTSDDAEDLWFCGYTPQITCAVWSGYPDARVAVTVNGGRRHNTEHRTAHLDKLHEQGACRRGARGVPHHNRYGRLQGQQLVDLRGHLSLHQLDLVQHRQRDHHNHHGLAVDDKPHHIREHGLQDRQRRKHLGQRHWRQRIWQWVR